jgi:hypothetical protein
MNASKITKYGFFPLLAALSLAAQGAVVPVSTQSGLGANDSIDWGQLGASPYTPVPSGSPVVSQLGYNATVSNGTGVPLQRQNDGDPWGGNFAYGEHLLYNGGMYGGGAIIITFASGVYGAGAHIEGDTYGPFTGTVSAYDANGDVLGTYTFNGVSTSAGDNSAVFAGFLDSSPDIRSISFTANVTIFGNLPSDFALGTLYTTAVPEPSTLVGGLLAVAFVLGTGPAKRILGRRVV